MSKNYAKEKDLPSTVSEAAIAYHTPYQKVSLARHGVTISFVKDLLEKYNFSKQELSQLIDISPKTLDRHLQSGKLFSGLQAERLLRLAELFQQGKEVFGKEEKFLKWINSEVIALQNTKPISWLDTQQGIDLISDEMGRIQHGIFA